METDHEFVVDSPPDMWLSLGMELSAAQFDAVLFNLAAFGTDSALRQVEIHRSNGDFSESCCDRLAAAVLRRGF